MDDARDPATFARLVNEQIEPLADIPELQVDYGQLVDLTVKQQYEDLRQLFHRLKTTNIAEDDRSRHVIHYAIHARTALIKLLVLLKWKNQADVDQILPNGEKQGRVSLAPGLDQWQDLQNHHNREVRKQLEQWSEDVKRFQLQTPDLTTAVDLLVTGDFKSGPNFLDSDFLPAKLLTVQGRSDTLQAMNELISYRLRVEEELPSRLQVVSIRDGKLYLKAERLFECAVTLGPFDPRQQWVLVDFRFLYVAKQSAKGKNARPDQIPEEVKSTLCETMDYALRGMYESRLATEASLGPDELLPRCKTFHKLYDILQLLSLSHQLEILHRQAKELEVSEWAGNLRVHMAPDRKSFSMTYWSKPTLQFTNAPARSSQSHGPTHGGQLVIKIAKVASREDDALYGTMSDTQPAVYALEVDWHPEPGWLGVNPGTKPVVDEDVFEVDPDDLDVEAILLDIVTFHAEQLTNGLKTFMDERLVLAGMFNGDDVSVLVTELGSNVVLRIYDERWLKLQINTITGQLHIGEADATIASSVEMRLATSSRLANIHTDKLLDVLINTRTMLARDALEEKLRCLELHPLRDLGVSIQELDAHNLASTGPGQPMKPILHASLPADPNKSVLLALHANSLTVAIVHFAMKITNTILVPGQPAVERRTISDMEWLNVADLPLTHHLSSQSRGKTVMIYDRLSRSQVQALSFELSLDDLQRVFAFCNAVITTRLIAAQFNGKGISPIPEVEVAPLKILSTGFALPRGTKRKLAIASRDIFPDQDVQAMISDVIHVSVERGHNSTVRPSKIIARLALRPKAVSVAGKEAPGEALPKSHQESTSDAGWIVRLDTRPTTASVSIESDISRNYVEGLSQEFARVGMLLRLLAEANRATDSSDPTDLKILRYDLTGVWLEYRRGQALLLATPRHIQEVYVIKRLQVDLEQPLRDMIVDLLQTVLEQQLGDGLGLGGFFQYAKLIGPCLEVLVQASKGMSAEVSPELAVCTKRQWVFLWERDDRGRYGVAISFILPGEFKDWNGGYLISDAANKGGLNDVRNCDAWEELVRRCNRKEDGVEEPTYGIELDDGRDLALEAGTGEHVVMGRLLSELGRA